MCQTNAGLLKRRLRAGNRGGARPARPIPACSGGSKTAQCPAKSTKGVPNSSRSQEAPSGQVGGFPTSKQVVLLGEHAHRLPIRKGRRTQANGRKLERSTEPPRGYCPPMAPARSSRANSPIPTAVALGKRTAPAGAGLSAPTAHDSIGTRCRPGVGRVAELLPRLRKSPLG